jgi:hypothetical protein
MSEGFGTRSESQQPIKNKPKLGTAVDAESIQAQWLLQFKRLQDPRGRKGVEHNLSGHCAYTNPSHHWWGNGLGRHRTLCRKPPNLASDIFRPKARDTSCRYLSPRV